MKQFILVIACLPLLFFACTTHEKENQRLTEELKMVREENSFLKAEIVSLQKQLDEVSAKVKEERESLQKKFEEERSEMYEKVREEREAIRKRAEEAAKRSSALKKEPSAALKKEPSAALKKEPSAALKKEPKEQPTPKNGHAPGANGKVQKKPVVE
jgi:hypothetical protein